MLLCCALLQSAWAIPAWHLDLEQVVMRGVVVFKGTIVRIEHESDGHGSILLFGLKGRKPLRYYAPWPATAPDGKVEAPVHTGSGLESRARAGESYLFIVQGESLLRIEPLSREAEIRRLLQR